MLVTFPSSQINYPRIDHYEEDPIGLLNPYPLGIHTIANHVYINKLSVSCIQCALFDAQSNRWALHDVEEIWRWQDPASEYFEYLFRLEGGPGLLDSAGNLVLRHTSNDG